jgi:hypothetical protein
MPGWWANNYGSDVVGENKLFVKLSVKNEKEIVLGV